MIDFSTLSRCFSKIAKLRKRPAAVLLSALIFSRFVAPAFCRNGNSVFKIFELRDTGVDVDRVPFGEFLVAFVFWLLDFQMSVIAPTRTSGTRVQSPATNTFPLNRTYNPGVWAPLVSPRTFSV